jgi:hypothetical protein
VDEEAKLVELIEVAKQKISEKGMTALKSALRILSSYKDELPAGAFEKLAEAAGYSNSKEEEKPEPAKKPEAPEEDEEKKNLRIKKEEEEVKMETEAIAKAQGEIDTLKKELQVERDNRLTEEWIRKAEAELSHYPGKSAKDLGTMLKKMADVDAAAAQDQFETMKAASVALKESNILKSAGTSGTGSSSESDAETKIEAVAAGIVEKSTDAKTTKEKAYAVALRQNPELYTQYLDEHPEQCSARR